MASIGQARPSPQMGVRAPGIRTPLFLLGVALALVAFIVMLAFGLIFASRSGSGAQIQVVVAATNIDARAPITPDMITTTYVPSAGVAPGAFRQLSDLNKMSAVVSIPKGQVISANLVSSSPDALTSATASSFLPIPPGYIAITLPTSEQQGVAGYIAQGDYINVVVTLNSTVFTPTPPSRMLTRTVFTNVHVIRVGAESTVVKQGAAQGVVNSITIVMTSCDAQFMNWFLVEGQVKYELLSYPDYAKPVTAPSPTCPSATTAPPVVGPVAVQKVWDFLAD